MRKARDLRAGVASAALLGTLPVALSLSLLLARMPGCGADARLTLGIASFVPLWIASICITATARSTPRAWLVCMAFAVIVGALLFLSSQGAST